jgi:hypothetical protein
MSGMDFLLSDFAADDFVFVTSDESIPSFPSSSKLSKDSKPNSPSKTPMILSLSATFI